MELVVEATSVDSPTGQPECDKIQSLEEKVAENPKPSGKKARKLKRLRNEPPVFIGLGEGPSEIRVLDFTKARASELKTMVKTLEGKGGVKRIFQYLPPHMRRRAMSHNPKRLPRRMRETAFIQQIDEASRRKKPPPSRKQRRKPSSLKKDYNRRQKENGWLETHFWHAKRMKMCKKYGSCLALHCNDKGIRAAWRSLVHGCLLSDISYYQCYEISGYQKDIIACLKQNFSEETGLTVKAKAYLKGEREGRAYFYKSGMYPHGAISHVQFQWMSPTPAQCGSFKSNKPVASAESQEEISKLMTESVGHRNTCKLWIWCHPAAKNEVFAELQKCVKNFNIQNSGSDQEVTVVHRDLVRFRLIGPRSHALLVETLKPMFEDRLFSRRRSSSLCEGFGCTDGDCGGDDSDDNEDEDIPPADKWWLDESCKDGMADHIHLFSEAYRSIVKASEPLEFPRGSVISVCVEDPRLYIPSKKTDMVSSHYPPKKKQKLMKTAHDLAELDTEREDSPSSIGSSRSVSTQLENSYSSASDKSAVTTFQQLPPGIAYSPLWDASVSARVSKGFISCEKLNKMRSSRALRSEYLDLGDLAPCIPVVLVQQPLQLTPSSLSARDYMGAGWDLIIPPQWAMAFWVSLVYRGARACGMRELAKVSLESLTPHFPQDYPDTASGQLCYLEQKEMLEAKFMKKPPQNRLNYGKLVVPTPFHFPWESLVNFWTEQGKHSGGGCYEVPQKKMKLEKLDSGGHNPVELNEWSDRDIQLPYVLRCRHSLKSLQQAISSALASRKQRARSASNVSHAVLKETILKYGVDGILQQHRGALVAVRLEISRSGNLQALNSLSLPTVSDLRLLLPSNGRTYSGPVEEINPHGMTIVENGKVEVGISSLSRKEIKELKSRRKKGEGKDSFVADCCLFLPQPSRPILGYITSAGHRLTTSLDAGIGFVTLEGLVQVLTLCHSTGHTCLQILARGTKTKYFFTKADLL